MKTVASLSELQRMAAQTGAVAKIGGRVINAEGAQVPVVVPRASPEPAKPDPAAVMAGAVQAASEASAQATREAIESMGKVIAESLERALAARQPGVFDQQPTIVVQQPTPEPARSWVFGFEYDKLGRISSASATSGTKQWDFQFQYGAAGRVKGATASQRNP